MSRVVADTGIFYALLDEKDSYHQRVQSEMQKIDATTAVLSAKMNIPIWTYDYHFDVMGSLVWRE